MSIPGTLDIEMRERMSSAAKHLQESPVPTVAKKVAGLLLGAEAGLRDAGMRDAILELRLGMSSNFGQRYPAYLRNERHTFEQPIFSFYDPGDGTYAFHADGDIVPQLNENELFEQITGYLLADYVVSFMTGLLEQFRPRDADVIVGVGNEASAQMLVVEVKSDPS